MPLFTVAIFGLTIILQSYRISKLMERIEYIEEYIYYKENFKDYDKH